MNKLTQWMLVVIVLSTALWLAPVSFRNDAVPLPWADSYNDVRLSRQWRGGLLTQDAQAQDKVVVLSPMHVAIALSGIDKILALRFLGVLSGVVGLVGLWLLLRRSPLQLQTRILALFLFGASTVTMNLFAVPSSLSFSVGWTVLALGLAMENAVILRMIAAIVALMVALAGPMEALHVAVIIGVALAFQRRFVAAALHVALPIMSGALVWGAVFQQMLSFSWVIPVVGVLAEFGARPGVGVMEWLVAMIAIGLLWRDIRRSIGIVFVLVLMYGSISTVGVAYTAPLWSSLAAVCLMRLYGRQWQYPSLRTLSLFAIGCGLLLSVLAVSASIIRAPPLPHIVEGIQEIAPGRVVLTHPPIAPWVQWWSGASVVFGSTVPEGLRGFQDSILQKIWYERDLANATVLLDRLGVENIVVTRDMRHGQVWSSEEEGLLFLLENSELFKRDFSNEEVDVWRYTPAPSAVS